MPKCRKEGEEGKIHDKVRSWALPKLDVHFVMFYSPVPGADEEWIP